MNSETVSQKDDLLTKPDFNLDLDLLLTYLYCTLDDEFPEQGMGRPQMANDAEMVCISIASVLLDADKERAWLRRVERRLGHLFPRIPHISQYNKRVRRLAPMFDRVVSILGEQYPEIAESLLIVDTTPVPCAQSEETVMRSRLGPGPMSKHRRELLRLDGNEDHTLADYGRCAAKDRDYWGFKLAYLCTPSGFPVGVRLLSANIAEQDALRALIKTSDIAGKLIAGDKGFRGDHLALEIEQAGGWLIRPDFINETPRYGKGLKIRQNIESCYQTFKGQLSLERHHARSLKGLTARVLERICALASALWLNNLFGQPGRHLTAYDH